MLFYLTKTKIAVFFLISLQEIFFFKYMGKVPDGQPYHRPLALILRDVGHLSGVDTDVIVCKLWLCKLPLTIPSMCLNPDLHDLPFGMSSDSTDIQSLIYLFRVTAVLLLFGMWIPAHSEFEEYVISYLTGHRCTVAIRFLSLLTWAEFEWVTKSLMIFSV